MRTSFFILAMSFLTSLALISCNKDDDNSNNNNNNNSNTTMLKSGTWKVTNFNEDGKDETYYFTGYSFDFQDNNVVTATSGTSVITGTWGFRNDSGKTKFDLNFGNVNKFEELNEDWEVLSQSDTKIELKHVSGGNGGTDFLRFEKN